jgi:hypothetical protein
MMLNQGRDIVRDLLREAISTVVIGTGATSETGADTGLEAQIAEKPASLLNGATGVVVARGRLSVSEGNGNTITEGGATIGGVLISRTTHSGLAKTSLVEAETEVTYRVVNV